ncbi:uncharacterized protein V1478_005197 [Vespula squamosa]|uniref:Chitin-binding type-2 domain-containing protein n=1 Tax=Vespula squamosa TaxID=30214 RepID=A0ABD2BDL6_VESSQ
MKACSATESNVTRSILNDEDEEGEREEDITFAEFKERYRRLIPYMAFYAANNNLNGQSVIPGKNFLNVPSSNEDVTSSRRSQQYQPLFSRTNVGTRNILNNYRTNNNNNNNLQNQLRKFVPSVQYDPNGDINGDTDYFIPIRYNTKVNHVDYYSSSTYNPYQDQKQSHQEVTKTNIDDNVQKDDRRYGRPIRPYLSTGNTREYVNRNQGLKPIQTNFPQDYAYDHVSGSSSKGKPIVDINYPSEDVDSLRYIPQAVISKGTQQTINLLDTPPPPPPLPPPNARQPVNVAPQRNLNFINLNPIIESFQLTERLPETLDKNNLDNSIKTLIEILNILHKAKIEEFPQLPQSSFSGLPSVTVRPIQRPSNYYQKLRPNTRPKVITESRFPAVPTSLLIPDDPDRLKPTSSYVNEVKAKVIVKPVAYTVDDFKSTPSYKDNEFRLVTPKLPVQSSYTFTDENDDKKVVHFQTPYAPQDISQQNDNNDNNNNNKNPLEISTQHSYEITEDLSDDIIDPDRFTIPQIITETTTAISQKQNVLEQNEISTSRPTINHPSLKYGVTRGKPNVDYPAYAVIPETEFSCKKQRYKGFFGDPSTGCQVWHYCDLNGGKSSFLCPNGTIFSQVALTCDWWFNVKCESTTQLYVLNERLYKYILPIMPKFPEDFTGPEVDRYLEIKFKEMEAKLKEKKLKKQQERKDKAKGKVQPIDDNSNKNRE